MRKLSIDFETRSEVDLKACGAYVYAQDPSTHVYMMGWAFDDDEVQVWLEGDEWPDEISEHVEADGEIHAFNATFERLMWQYVLEHQLSICQDTQIPIPRLEQWRCTAVRARAHGLPGDLGSCAKILGLPQVKQQHGTRLIREYCVKNIPWDEIPEEDQEFFLDYCRIDVEVERMVALPLRELTGDEWYEYAVNEQINDAGIPVDLDFAHNALAYAEDVREEVDDKIQALTDFKVANSRKRKTRDEWLFPQLTPEAKETLLKKKASVDKETGEVIPAKYSFDQEHRDALRLHPDTPENILTYLDLLDEAGGATISKYKAMADRAINGKVNGSLIFNGAGQTGRFSSMGFQAHNLKRAGLSADQDADELIQDVIDQYEIEDVTKTLGALVRFAIRDKRRKLTWFDYSAIEGRVAPWLANSAAGERKLELFRQGIDTYVATAASTFGIPMYQVTKDQRQAGKVQELSMQFLGGSNALRSMGRNYGMHITEDEGEFMKTAWRDANPWAMAFGKQLEAAAMRAVINPGTVEYAGRLSFMCDGGDWLWMMLPCGRVLAYFAPRIEDREAPWGDVIPSVTCAWGAAKPKKGAKGWPRRALYSGLLIENATQGTAASLLRRAIVGAWEAGLDVCLHVHDEIVVHGQHVNLLGKIMLDKPEWAAGLPLTGEGDTGPRYGK